VDRAHPARNQQRMGTLKFGQPVVGTLQCASICSPDRIHPALSFGQDQHTNNTVRMTFTDTPRHG
jgi:hypothetical protein